MRFTALGGRALEDRIARDLGTCVQHIYDALSAIPIRGVVVGGGLGRGEGGLRRELDARPLAPDAPRMLELPYNDYDLFVVLPDLPSFGLSLARRRLGHLADDLGARLGVEVEIAALRERDLAAAPPTLMMTDLRAGHRVIAGPPDLLAAMPALPPELLAPVEASRLLLNRGALLLMAHELVGGGPLSAQDRERASRYTRKSALARGDAWLILRGRYVTGARLCAARLQAEAPTELAAAYGRAVEERLSGDEAPGDEAGRLAAESRALVEAFGRAEAARLGGAWPPFTGYGPAVLAADGPPGPRERLRVARMAGVAAAVGAARPWARCAATLPWLLAQEQTGATPFRALGPARSRGDVARWLALWRASA